MFPARHTWWLVVVVLTLNGIDRAAFEILNIGNPKITVGPHIKVIDGLFQALAIRKGGFYVIPTRNIRISVQVLYVIMMYISVYPVVISMRIFNVYEERSLGIYARKEKSDDTTTNNEEVDSSHPGSVIHAFRRATGLASKTHLKDSACFVRQQLRAQIANDAWWIAFSIFAIMINEAAQFERDPLTFSVFSVLFEMLSGYGNVGVSVGLPFKAFSFCGSWHALSKLVLAAVMVRGRHRGLPVAIGRAVALPCEALDEAEEEDGRRTEREERDWGGGVSGDGRGLRLLLTTRFVCLSICDFLCGIVVEIWHDQQPLHLHLLPRKSGHINKPQLFTYMNYHNIKLIFPIVHQIQKYVHKCASSFSYAQTQAQIVPGDILG